MFRRADRTQQAEPPTVKAGYLTCHPVRHDVRIHSRMRSTFQQRGDNGANGFLQLTGILNDGRRWECPPSDRGRFGLRRSSEITQRLKVGVKSRYASRRLRQEVNTETVLLV
jgi:hypothetical protein